MARIETTNPDAAASATAPTKSVPQSISDTRGRRDTGQPASDQAKMSDIERLRFEATVNGRYHASRQGWYELMHRICMFIVVIGGTVAVAEAVGSGSAHSWLIAVIPTVAGTLDLVFDFGAKAALHARLQERSYDIIAEIESSQDSADLICRRGWTQLARICAQETKVMRVVHALAYNDTKEGTDDEAEAKGDLLVIPGSLTKLFKHVRSYPDLKIKRANEIKKVA
jgi:hypothetical protein